MNLDKQRMIAIIGDIDSGKTNLAIYQLRQYKGQRKIYTLGYPYKIDNFIPLAKKQDMGCLTDSIIFVDELTKFFPCRERHTNEEFMQIARILSHTGNTIIFTTQQTQDLTERMEAFVDCFLITKIVDLRYLKKGSATKNAVLDCADYRLTLYSLNLKQGEYYESSLKNPIGENGIKEFPFQNIGKDWVVRSGAQSCAQSSAESCAVVRSTAQSMAQSCAVSSAESGAVYGAELCANSPQDTTYSVSGISDLGTIKVNNNGGG
jgi:hypothetical protein